MIKNRRLSNVTAVVFASAVLLVLAAGAQAQFTLQKINDRKTFKPTTKGYGVPLAKLEYSDGVDVGILRCQRGRNGIIANCVVRNMPLLLQTDPRLDADVKDLGLNGCYDTSLATVILTALANRTNTQPLKGRTKQFAEVPASGSIPKEVEQLSWYYRVAKKAANKELDKNGKPIQPFYLAEVLADFGKLNETCNPYAYAFDCKSATSSFGHSFYEYSDGKDWTNEFVIKKMREGYVFLIAYARYRPFIAVEMNRKVVKFAPTTVHKVVFSGFQIGNKYPLLINDVGTGVQNRVRLGTDLYNRRFALSNGTGVQTFNATDIVYPPGVKTATFMEYEGTGNGVNDEVQFIAHIDALKLK